MAPAISNIGGVLQGPSTTVVKCDVATYLARVVPPGNYLNIHINRAPGVKEGEWRQRTFAGTDYARAANYAVWAASQGYDAYFVHAALNLAQTRVDKRGNQYLHAERKQTNVQRLRALVIDGDVARPGDGKDPAKVFPDRGAAMGWLTTFTEATGLPLPNLAVNSGYGFHWYWLLETPLAPHDWQPLADAMKAAMIASHFPGDTAITIDSARILRPPGTVNMKSGRPIAVEPLPKLQAADYPNAQIEAALQPWVSAAAQPPGAVNSGAAVMQISPKLGARPAHVGQPAHTLNAAATQNIERRDFSFARIAQQCQQVGMSLAARGKGDQYQLWYLGHLTLAHFCADGADFVHQVSDGDPRYTAAETDRMVARIAHEVVAKGRGAPRCTSYDSYRPGVCHGCPHFGRINSPLSLSAEVGGNSTASLDAVPPPPLSAMPSLMDEALALAEGNERFAFVGRFGAQATYVSFEPDGTVMPRKVDELQLMLANRYVTVPDGKGGFQHVSAARWWMTRFERRSYDRAAYDPENKLAAPGEKLLNLWRGLGVQPCRGSWRRMRRHIWQVICGRDKRAFKYLLHWLAHVVQFPGTNPETMIVIRSDMEGVGKSSLGQWMLRIFGPHGLELADPDGVLGSFNASLDCRSFVLMEEPAFPGDHARSGRLKAMLTARTLRINPKGRPAYEIPNTMHCMMTTNAAWVVPAGAGARRFLILDVQDKMDRAYFNALWTEADNGGVAAMLHDLQRINLTRANLRDVPVTRALIEQQRRTGDDICQWITDAVVLGALVPGTRGGGFGATLPGPDIYGAYLTWTQGQGRRPKTAREFGRALGQLGLVRGAGNNPARWTIPDAATLLAASDRRAGIRRS